MLKDISLSDDDKKTYRQEYIRIMTGSYKDDDENFRVMKTILIISLVKLNNK